MDLLAVKTECDRTGVEVLRDVHEELISVERLERMGLARGVGESMKGFSSTMVGVCVCRVGVDMS